MPRRRSSPHTFEDNIAAQIAKMKDQLAKSKSGPKTDAIRKKIGELEMAAQMGVWLRPPGAKPR